MKSKDRLKSAKKNCVPSEALKVKMEDYLILNGPITLSTKRMIRIVSMDSQEISGQSKIFADTILLIAK
jgi:hypothetical protein